MIACPNPDTLLSFLEGDLDALEESRIVGHVEACGTCQNCLERLTCSRSWVDAESATGVFWDGAELGSRSTARWGDTPDLGPSARARPAEATVLVVNDEDRPTNVLAPGAGPVVREADLRVPTADPVVPGYDMLQRLGEGGMGVVYRARHRGLNRLVALKMIRGGSHARSDFFGRFRVEAESVARLRHPNIIQIYDIGETGGLPFVALELLDGGSLDAKLGGNPQPGRMAAELTMTLATAVQVAHDAGIIHRDLKPANVLYATDGVPKVTDFGLAKWVDSDNGQTLDDQILGSPSYMAPEQARGQSNKVGPAADVHALGAMLYEMLTGRPPFKGESPMETVRQVIDDDPVPPSRLVPRIPIDLETICLKCLHKDPARRYASARALADDLRRYLDGVPIAARGISPWERGRKWARRHPLAALAAAVVAVAIPVSFGMVLDANRRYMALHTEATDRLFRAREGLARNDLVDAEINLSSLRAKLQDEPGLADLSAAAAELLGDVERRRAEQATRASDRARYDDFIRLRDDALFRETRFTGLGLADTREATRQAARAALDLYAAGGPADPWTLRPLPRSLTDQERSEVSDGCYGLLLILAANEPSPDRGLGRLDEAARLRPPTRAYHLRRAACLARAGDPSGSDRERRAAEALEPVTAFDHFLAGQERFERKDFDGANREFDMALQLQPDYFWAQALSAICWLQLNQPAEARAGLDACLQREKRFAWLYILRGFATGQIAGLARELIGTKPDPDRRVDRLYNAAELNYRRAEALLDGGSDPGLRYAILVNRGVLRLTLRRNLDEAVELLRAAISLAPEGFEARVALAKVLQSQERPDEAVEQYGRAIALRPREAELYRERARMELRRGGSAADRRSRALADMERAIAFDATGSPELARDQVRRARLLAAERRDAEALAACEAAIKVVPDDEEAHRIRLELLFRLRKYDDMIRSCDPLIAAGKGTAAIHEWRALAHEQTRDLPGAIEDFTAALALAGDRARLLKLRGRVYNLVDAPRLALHDFEDAIRIDPSDGDAHGGRAFARVKLGQIRGAIADAEAAVSIGPPTADRLYRSARVLAMAATAASADVRKKGQDAVLVVTRCQERAADLLREAIRLTPADRRAAFVNDVVLGDPELRTLRRRFSPHDLAGPSPTGSETAAPSNH